MLGLSACSSLQSQCCVFNQQIQLNELHAAFSSNQATIHQIVNETSGTLGNNTHLQVQFPLTTLCVCVRVFFDEVMPRCRSCATTDEEELMNSQQQDESQVFLYVCVCHHIRLCFGCRRVCSSRWSR